MAHPKILALSLGSLLLAATLAGCGQTGPLYLPEQEQPPELEETVPADAD
ncbi:LPS translocon maturation chaperone LptM [Marinimicrobium alkaliphilum]|nr:lipoprotein [Marinimicrobium alkaliphilum]